MACRSTCFRNAGIAVEGVSKCFSERREGVVTRGSVLQVLEEHFPESLPLPIPEGIAELGRMDLVSNVLSSEGLQNVEAIQVCTLECCAFHNA